MDQDADGAVPEFIYGSIYRRVAVELPNIFHEQSSSGVGELHVPARCTDAVLKRHESSVCRAASRTRTD